MGHPRFSRLSANIRERRGEKVAINIPIFKVSFCISSIKVKIITQGEIGHWAVNYSKFHTHAS